MQNLKVKLQYDGTNYHGWQIQHNARTIQGELTQALSLLDHRPVTLYGAGRTDAGVHAEGQVANFFLNRAIDTRELRDAINGNLDRDIRVIDAERVPESFNARHSAVLKTYRYRICNADVVSPFIYRYVYHYRAVLDVDEMKLAAAALTGNHDFSAFTVADTEAENPVRTLSRLEVERIGDEMLIHAAAKGFLRYMVRTIVGTLIDVGAGKQTAAGVDEILRSRERRNAGPTAPAAGLTLVSVDY